MKLALVSDTHVKHEKLAVPPCDLIVHAGDFSRKGTLEETRAFSTGSRRSTPRRC
ncbi:MAG: hypothetical protein HC923_03260 [Myxococcales bacterium]|nr:hypothetical protein [Myxococcales bacterium]